MSPHLRLAGPSHARGLAVLCGWGGSSLRNVSKYEPLWHRLGWRTVTAAMSLDMVFYPSRWTTVGAVTDAIARECRSQRSSHGPDARVIAHAFSNGGALLKLSLLDQGDLFFDGTLYDSAPSRQGIPLPAGAPFVIAASGNTTSRIGMDVARHLPYALAASMAYPFVELPSPIGLFPRLFTTHGNSPRPELFVYGDKDFLIPPSHVEDFMALRKSQGCEVDVLGPLVDSPHCGHLRAHPEQYAAAVESFVAKVVAKGGGHPSERREVRTHEGRQLV